MSEGMFSDIVANLMSMFTKLEKFLLVRNYNDVPVTIQFIHDDYNFQF